MVIYISFIKRNLYKEDIIGDNIHFEFHMKGKVYPATLCTVINIRSTRYIHDDSSIDSMYCRDPQDV